MQTSLNINLKKLRLTALLLLSPLCFFAQQLTGLWTGILSNDSSTIRKDQSYEIVLTEYRGKVYGYTRSEFIVNDTLYYIVKRVKGIIAGDVCEVKDDEVVSYNFRGRLDKGVKLVNTFRLNKEDSSWHLDGKWKTNATKNYYSITGKTELKIEKDLAKSKLFPHLEELRLADNVAFYKEQKTLDEKNKKGVVIKKIAPTLPINKPTPETETVKKEPPRVKIAVEPPPTSPALNNTNNKPPAVMIITETANQPEKKLNTPAVILNQPKAEINRPEVTVKKEPQTVKEVVITPAIAIVPEPKPATSKSSDKKNITIISPGAAALVSERIPVFADPLIFKSDSLQLALYDNGEIDGDTVSILLNGEIILANQGLKASAIRKTIYLTPILDSLVLVLYAENLGKYPPNTGLLVVRDGEDVYNVRFSADLQKNAAIMFRRKKQ